MVEESQLYSIHDAQGDRLFVNMLANDKYYYWNSSGFVSRDHIARNNWEARPQNDIVRLPSWNPTSK